MAISLQTESGGLNIIYNRNKEYISLSSVYVSTIVQTWYNLIKYPRGYIFNINDVGAFLHLITLVIGCSSLQKFITHRKNVIFRKINFITIENKMQWSVLDTKYSESIILLPLHSTCYENDNFPWENGDK